MKKRVISAIIALIICIPLLIIGGYPFYIGVSILSAIGYYEIINIRERERKVPLTIKIIGLITYLMIVLNNVVSSIMFYIDYKVLAITAFLLMLPIIFFDRKKYNVNDALYLIGTSIFLGISFNLLNIPIGSVLDKTVNYLADGAIPLIMISLGLSIELGGLARSKAMVIFTSIIKLGVFPLIALIVVSLLGLTGLQHDVGIIEAAMPSGMLSLLLAITYKLDYELTSDCILINTVISLITLPIIMTFL